MRVGCSLALGCSKVACSFRGSCSPSCCPLHVGLFARVLSTAGLKHGRIQRACNTVVYTGPERVTRVWVWVWVWVRLQYTHCQGLVYILENGRQERSMTLDLLLFTVRSSLCTLCCLLFIHYLLFVIYSLLFALHYWLFTTRPSLSCSRNDVFSLPRVVESSYPFPGKKRVGKVRARHMVLAGQQQLPSFLACAFDGQLGIKHAPSLSLPPSPSLRLRVSASPRSNEEQSALPALRTKTTVMPHYDSLHPTTLFSHPCIRFRLAVRPASA